ncbi:CAP domain-containing protein [Caballeronia sp. 15715]|uniref:CAP domain-containing protein n=1 Tax=Caballeronia sp. 15715 TaxID=3391030 RepID=UPI0039E54117
MAFINRQRTLLGLPTMAANAAVAQAATNHSLYLQDNNVVGHFETAGLRGFTGVTPTDRVNPLYPTTGAGEILSAVFGPFQSSAEPIESLFDAPFHRSGILSDATTAGAGIVVSASANSLSALTVDFVDFKPAAPDDKLIAYPYPGQTDAQASWLDTESPDPFAAAPQSYFGKTVGYPVTLIGANAASFSQVSFAITDATGANVPCQESDSSNNAEAAHMAMCAPFAPLAASAAYSVHVTGLLANQSFTAPRPFDVSWTFTTAATATTPAVSKAMVGVPARQVRTDSARAPSAESAPRR